MDTVALVGRLMLSLAFVLGLMWVIARKVKGGAGRMKSASMIDVLGRQQLTRSSSVAVVRVLDKALIVGITDGQVTVLGESELSAVREQLAEAETKRRGPRAARAPRPARISRAARAPRPDRMSRVGRTGRIGRAGRKARVGRDGRDGISAGVPGYSPQRPVPQRTPATGPPSISVDESPPRRSALAGSALSITTWRQSLDALRELTVRIR